MFSCKFDIFTATFVRSGHVYLPGNSGATFMGAGVYGHWWSSRGDVVTNAYYLLLNATTAYPSRGPYERWHGFPLRCLSTGLDMIEQNLTLSFG